MSVKIIRGAIGSGKRQLCIAEIEKIHKEHPECRCIMLVPDHYSFETERAFVKYFGGIGLNNIEVLTPRKMAVEFLPANNLKYLSDSGRQMLISRAIKEYCEEEQMSLLIRTMKTAGFPHTMENIISEMKKYCVTPDMLENGIKLSDNDMLKEKIGAISAIYRKYNIFFEEGEYTDSNDDLYKISQIISENSFFNEKLYIWIDCFDEFLPGHMAVIEAMAEKNVNITVCLNYPNEDEYGTYSCVSSTYEKIRAVKGYEKDIFCEDSLSYINSAQIRYMIENYNNISAEYNEDVCDISLFASRDSYNEIEHTAGEILKMVRTGNYRFRDIVVVCGNFDEVKHIIKAVFDEYGIPYFSDEKIMLLDHPIAMQILSVFDIFEEDWSYSSVMRYLRSGFIYDENGNRLEQSDIDKLDNFLLKYGIHGRKKWEEEKWMPQQDSFEKVWGDIPFEEEENEEINNIKKLVTKPVFELFGKIKSGKTAYSYAKALFEFMESIRMYQGLRKDVKAFEEIGKNDEAIRFSEIWNLILEILDQTVVTMGERKITFAEYGEYIRSGLAQCEIKTIPSSLDGVCIGTVERTTSTPAKVLFVTGAVGGTYPPDLTDDGMLSDLDRTNLKEQCGIFIAPDTKSRMEQQYFKVYKALAAVTDKLFVSYHVQNGEGKAVGKSQLVQNLESMFLKLKTEDNIITDYSDRSYISAPSATLHKLFINKSQNFKTENSAEWEKVYRWFKEDEKYSEKLHLLETASAFSLKDVSIKKSTASELFGNGDAIYSASRLNVYSMCPFSYFMKYGLDAKEQEIAKIAASDFGSYAHRFIQEFCVQVEGDAKTPEEKLERWRNLSDAQRNECIESISENTKTKIREFDLFDEEKRCNIIDRISKTVKGSAAVVHKSLKKGKYTAAGYEKEFEKIQLSDNVYITGAVDRVDSYTENDKEYIRIIDYKTGNTGFDILNIRDGVNMQMVIYAIAVKKVQEEIKHTEVNLSGIFYNKVKNEIIKSNSAEEAGAEHTKNMRLDGVIFADENADGGIDMRSLYAVDEDIRSCEEQKLSYKSDFAPLGMYKNGRLTGVHTQTEGKALMSYVKEKVCDIDASIRNGKFEISPYEENSNSNSCTWCKYKEACVFERENAKMRKSAKTKDEVWADILKEYKESENNG